MLKLCKMFMVLLVVCMLTVACSKPNSSNQVKIAFINLDQVMPSHALYAEYESSRDIIKKLENSKTKQQELARKQMSGLDDIVTKGMENRKNFDQALMSAKMTELEALAKMELIEAQEVVKKELKPVFAEREQAIRDDYKIPIFNIRANLSIVKLKPEERDKLMVELETLEQEQAKRLNDLEREKMSIVRERTKDQEAAIVKRLSETAMGTYQQMLIGSEQQNADMDKKMNKLAEEMQRTLFNIQQEIDNQKNKQELLYNKMYQDIESAAAKIAQEKGYEIVLRDVKVNIKAIDITQEIKAELVKYSNNKK